MTQRGRKKIKITVLLICAIILPVCAFLWRQAPLYSVYYGWMQTLTEQDYAELTAARTRRQGEEGLQVKLRYDGDALPYDRFTNTFMRFDSVSEAGLTVEDAQRERQADYGSGSGMKFARLPGRDGFMAYTADAYTEYTFWETTVPVLVLNTEGEEITDGAYQDITMQVFDEASKQKLCVDMTAGIHTRGASSSWIPKKSYRMKLEAVEGLPGKQYGFFGMKPAREWVLLSLYGDESKMREKLARDLWDTIEDNSSYADAGTGLELQYCEVYAGDEYLGLYGMGTAIDHRNYWLEKKKDSQDLLFKSINFNAPTREDLKEADAETEAVQCLELKYASWTSDDMWQTIGNYMHLAYYASDQEYLAQMKEYMNEDNHIDYWLFFLAAGLDDNELKNIYFTITDAKNSREILMTPWDMDMAWGVGYTGEDIFMWGRNENQYKKIMDFPIVSRMYRLGDEEMIKRTKERWAKLREHIITEESLLEEIRSNDALLRESGILAREKAKWPEAKYADDIEYIENYVKKRLPYLDAYIAQLGEGEWDAGFGGE